MADGGIYHMESLEWYSSSEIPVWQYIVMKSSTERILNAVRYRT